MYKIGEVARRAGLTARTIRYYEELGLLARRENRLSGQTRHFDDNDLRRLDKIDCLKKVGLSLEESAQVLDLYFTDGRECEGKRRVLEILRGHLANAEHKLATLQTFKREIEANIAKVEALLQRGQGCEKTK